MKFIFSCVHEMWATVLAATITEYNFITLLNPELSSSEYLKVIISEFCWCHNPNKQKIQQNVTIRKLLQITCTECPSNYGANDINSGSEHVNNDSLNIGISAFSAVPWLEIDNKIVIRNWLCSFVNGVNDNSI